MLDLAQCPNYSSVLTFELKLLNNLTDLERLNPWVEDCAEIIDLSMRNLFRLQLVLEEIVMNVFENAYSDEDPHHIIVRINVEASGLIVQVEDNGIPFDPTTYPDIQLPTKLEDASIGGLGLHLVHNYADQFTYQRKGDKNILTLVIQDHQK